MRRSNPFTFVAILAVLLLIADLGACVKVVKLVNKGSGQAFRGPEKLIRNLNYDTLDYNLLQESVDIRSKRKPPQTPDPAVPLFMRLADANEPLKEWKSATFSTKVTFGFPPKIGFKGVNLQLELSIGIKGETKYDNNAKSDEPGIVTGAFQLAVAGAVKGKIGKAELSMTLHIEGNMELTSRVPADILWDKEKENVYPLLGTLWSVKQWVLNKVKNTRLYKWYKDKKKAGMNKEMTKLLIGIHADFEGTHDAAAKEECETYCNKYKSQFPKICAPVNPKSKTCGLKGKEPCSKVSSDCDKGVKWAKDAYVDYCGEMVVETATCKKGKLMEDGQMDSDALKDSADIMFVEFINKLRTNGKTLLKHKDAAYTAHDTSKENPYRDTIETIWRQVYMGSTEAEAKDDLDPMKYVYVLGHVVPLGVFDRGADCRSIPGAYDPVKKKIGTPKTAIAPLLCAWMKYGGSLSMPATGWIFTDGKGNANLKESMLHLYKDLFPVPGTKADTAATRDTGFESWITRLDKDPDMMLEADDRTHFLGGWDSKDSHGIDIRTFNVHAVHTILSLPPADVMGGLTAMMDDITDAGNKFDEGAMKAKGCEPTVAGCCGLQSVELAANIGVTLKAPSPLSKSNTLKFSVKSAMMWKVDEKATKKGGREKDTAIRKGYCFLGSFEFQEQETTLEGRIGLGVLGTFIDINIMAKGKDDPTQIVLKFSLLSEALPDVGFFTRYGAGGALAGAEATGTLIGAGATGTLTSACSTLKAIWEPIKTAFKTFLDLFEANNKFRFPGKKEVKEWVMKRNETIPNALKVCFAGGTCKKSTGEAGNMILVYIAGLIKKSADNTANQAGEVAKAASYLATGGQLVAEFKTKTVSTIALEFVFNQKPGSDSDALFDTSTWSLAAADGADRISFSVVSTTNLKFGVGGLFSGAGVDINVDFSMSEGSSVDCSGKE